MHPPALLLMTDKKRQRMVEKMIPKLKALTGV